MRLETKLNQLLPPGDGPSNRQPLTKGDMMKSKWNYSGDVNMLDYGGKNYRWIGGMKWQFVELINMDEACGRDNEGQAKYVVELRLVDLAAISDGVLRSALQSCGMDGKDITNEITAECCDGYGAHAPLGSWSGSNARKLLREAYREANSLLDNEALETRMERSVNKIGSTAREFMTGDITAAIQRGVESGSPDARIMAKMYGAPQATIDNTRPDDWMPYFIGYMAGVAGGAKESDPDTSPEYFRGYARGEAVKLGTCPAPDWIKSSMI